MNTRSPKAEEILDAAETMARTGGYNGFSFREIAKQVGIKAASVHYHFPGKDDLGAAVTRRYTDRFLAGLGAPDTPDTAPEMLLHRYIDAYRRSIVEDDLMCLCGLFGAEISDLPDPVADETRRFFDRNIDWVAAVFARRFAQAEPDACRAAAMRLIATLEGGLILARSLDDPQAFDAVTRGMSLDL